MMARPDNPQTSPSSVANTDPVIPGMSTTTSDKGWRSTKATFSFSSEWRNEGPTGWGKHLQRWTSH